jgi:hypothetical protein
VPGYFNKAPEFSADIDYLSERLSDLQGLSFMELDNMNKKIIIKD